MATTTLESPVSVRLLISRKDAGQQLQAQLKIGQAIRNQRIRDAGELSDARQEKAEWITRTVEVLNRAFDTAEIADGFGDWVGKILPEYAELEMFVEQFYEEMDHRLGRLKTVVNRLDQIPQMGEAMTMMQDAPAVTTTTAAASSPANSAPPPPTPPKLSAQVSTRAAAPASGLRSQPVARTGVALVLHTKDDATQDAASAFIRKLGIQTTVAEDDGSEGGVMAKLAQARDVGFALLLMSAEDVAGLRNPSQENMARLKEHMFELGFFAGRLGLKRVAVLYRGSELFTDDQGVIHVPIDPAEGWQLQVARQLRRAGLEVDLNKLC